MSLTTRLITTSTLAGALILGVQAAAHADTDLAGHWNSASLRQDGVGYSLSLTATSSPATAYNGVLVMHFQDGRLGKRTKVGLVEKGDKVTLVMPGGSLASGRKTLAGTIGQDGSLFFKNCQKEFTYVTKATAPQMCMFEEFALR
ncbi:MAG: hypothetical protein PSX37_03845 [bacterium]|nr:hypothetical protein [bacterium]